MSTKKSFHAPWPYIYKNENIPTQTSFPTQKYYYYFQFLWDCPQPTGPPSHTAASHHQSKAPAAWDWGIHIGSLGPVWCSAGGGGVMGRRFIYPPTTTVHRLNNDPRLYVTVHGGNSTNRLSLFNCSLPFGFHSTVRSNVSVEKKLCTSTTMYYLVSGSAKRCRFFSDTGSRHMCKKSTLHCFPLSMLCKVSFLEVDPCKPGQGVNNNSTESE